MLMLLLLLPLFLFFAPVLDRPGFRGEPVPADARHLRSERDHVVQPGLLPALHGPGPTLQLLLQTRLRRG